MDAITAWDECSRSRTTKAYVKSSFTSPPRARTVSVGAQATTVS
jgi:hypothetical protein